MSVAARALNLSSPFVLVAEECVREDASLASPFDKAHGALSLYAGTRKNGSLDSLSVLDVVGHDGNLHRDLVRFLGRYYTNASTRSSQKSNLVRLSRAVLRFVRRAGREEKDGGGIGAGDLPEYMRPVWELLPRAKCGRPFKTVPRSSIPLSLIGEQVIKALLAVHYKTGSSTLAELFVQNSIPLSEEVGESVPHRLRSAVRTQLYLIRRHFALAAGRPERKLEDVPPRLRSQIETFLKLAPAGLGAVPELASAAIRYGAQLRIGNRKRTLKGLASSSITGYRAAILSGLAQMDLPEDVSVEDLLRVVPTVRVMNGREIPDMHNPYIDQFRFAQANEETPYKGAGYDKGIFSYFLSGLKAVAIFNGYFELIEPFNKAYRTRADVDKKRARKKKKRRVMTRAWLHENIMALYKQYKQIIRTKSFRHSRRDLQLCLFFVQLIVLRYMGFRQQCLRNCRIGTHIFIVPGKSVTFKWQAGEIKNEVEIDTTISLEEHGHIPELVLLLNVLSKYYSHVVPFFPEMFKDKDGRHDRARYEAKIGDSFFGYVQGNGTLSRHANAHRTVGDDSTRFWRVFKNGAYKFMDFANLPTWNVEFHPHFLRSVCCDWMRYELGMSWEDIAQVLGDTEWTVRREYFDDLNKKSATEPFASVSRRRAEKQQLELSAAANQSEKTVALMKDHIQLVTEKADFFQEKCKRLEEELYSSQEETRRQNERMAELLAELARLQPLESTQLVAV